ncbi:response regulator [Mucilaginibacter corticis]|uniref:Response regulator n=1 Tax=Mucilaginibacter corticis TaxID=2597670 RepID=A0A556MM58_9SPHI|nr:response regulator [Mucilaginibacter corticis]TSJ41011.1 response regulator [Mucilaginibacter corticis]
MKHILIVDDHEDILELIRDILEPEGYRVTTLSAVDDILKTVRDLSPDLVLLDFLLPGINGGEFCAQLKKDPLTSHTPVIFLSAHSRVLDSLGHYGYDDFIAKPFAIDQLLQTVKKHI